MSDAYKALRDRSRWLQRLATCVFCALAAAIGLEAGMALNSHDTAFAAASLVIYRLPVLFYLTGVWAIRQTFSKLAGGDIFSELLPALLRRLGLALAGGGVASVFLTPWLWRALPGPMQGSWASFDPSAIAVGLAGLLMIVLGDLMRRAADMKHELDGFL
jgi:Protein of unknown function (DUF2975)